MLIQFLLINIITHSILCFPSVIIKTNVNKNQEEQQHIKEGNHDAGSKVGSSGFNSEDGYNKGNENKHTNAEDYRKYSEENKDNKQHLDQSDFSNKKFQQEGGGSVADYANKLAHKKGHHKSGFHNTYHKDESGSNSSYYDDSNDEGGKYVHDSRQGSYGDVRSQNNQGSHLDGNYYAKEDTKGGGYNKGGNYNRDVGDNRNYNQENYYNNYDNRANSNAGNQHGSSGGYNVEKYHHQQPQYYDAPYYYDKPYYEPRYHQNTGYRRDYYEPSLHTPKKTITIYEDPRYYENYERYPQYKSSYGGSSVALDVRPPIQANGPEYYDAREYDNYYY